MDILPALDLPDREYATGLVESYGYVIFEHIVQTFKDDVTKDKFRNLVFQFLRILWGLKNPKIADYKKALDTFQTQHYHAFLYHCQSRSNHCRAFIKVLKDFDEVTKKAKKHYVDLFAELEAFQLHTGLVRLPGGTYKGIPFVFLAAKRPDAWYYDQVLETKKKFGVRGQLLMYPRTFEDDTLHVDCPANRCWKAGGVSQHIRDNRLCQYLVEVGYETPESAKTKWGVECSPRESHEKYALFLPNVSHLAALIEEVKSNHRETVLDCVRTHLRAPQNMRENVIRNILKRYDSTVQELTAERDHLAQKCRKADADTAEQEMQLNTSKRKLSDLYTDMDRMHWDVTDAHIKRVQAETEVRRLAAMLRQKDDELRKSIEAQWQMYYRLNPTAQRF